MKKKIKVGFVYKDDYIFLKGIALLQWFDRFLQKNYSDKKIIHLYSFKEEDIKFEVGILKKNNIHFDFYPHIFEQGINIKPELIKFSKLFDWGFSEMSFAPLLKCNFMAISVLGLRVTSLLNL